MQEHLSKKRLNERGKSDQLLQPEQNNIDALGLNMNEALKTAQPSSSNPRWHVFGLFFPHSSTLY
jgi:hypothetical protein